MYLHYVCRLKNLSYTSAALVPQFVGISCFFHLLFNLPYPYNYLNRYLPLDDGGKLKISGVMTSHNRPKTIDNS